MGPDNAETNVKKISDRVLFEVSCKVNFKRQFYFQLYIFKKRFLKIAIIMLILMLIICFLKPDAFNLIVTALYCCFPFLSASFSALNEVLSCEDVPDKYTFYQDRIENKDFKGNNTAYYNESSAAYETENYFYIHAGKKSWCIIDKDKITGGTSDDMKAFLEEQLGSRFDVNKKERK